VHSKKKEIVKNILRFDIKYSRNSFHSCLHTDLVGENFQTNTRMGHGIVAVIPGLPAEAGSFSTDGRVEARIFSFQRLG